jgi:hypothetical protein
LSITASLAAVGMLAGCSAGDLVTPQTLAAAKQIWSAAGIHDYELEWTASGLNNARYYVAVKGGVVRKIESIAPDGRRYELRPAEPRFYGVDGLFVTIADELAQLSTERPFGQPKGAKVVMRFTPDPKLGYPRSYRRNVLGTSQGLAIDVIRLIIDPAGARDSAEPAS